MRNSILLASVAFSAVACASARVEHVNPSTLPKPSGYTHVISTQGGRTIYVSGQIALNAQGQLVGAGDFSAQTRQVFENVKAALEASGSSFADVVKVTVFVTDASKLLDYRKVRDDYVGSQPPASSFVEVRALARPELMIEMEAVAVAR